jgi:uncharacterized protein
MRWKRGVGRDQIQDRRGMGGGRMGLPIGVGGGGLGIVGVIIAILFATGVFGGGGAGASIPGIELPGMPAADGSGIEGPDPDARLVDFMGFVVDDVQDSWRRTFANAEQPYEETDLVIFEQATPTACGTGSAATGPFYCPADALVYLDLGFFRELRNRFGAPGDFAQAYVIAHEFGHHVQNVLGISDEVRRLQQENPDQANEYSIKLELQADCLAGVWAHSAYQENLLEPGDLKEGLAAAAAVGDDRIQEQATGRIDQESWTHGSSEQRTEWFRRGYEAGDPNACDTFST